MAHKYIENNLEKLNLEENIKDRDNIFFDNVFPWQGLKN